MGVSIKNYFGLDLWVDGGWYGSLGSKYHVIKDDMRFYTLIPSRYFELRILLDNVKRHTLQLVQYFGIVVMFFFLHCWFL